MCMLIKVSDMFLDNLVLLDVTRSEKEHSWSVVAVNKSVKQQSSQSRAVLVSKGAEHVSRTSALLQPTYSLW